MSRSSNRMVAIAKGAAQLGAGLAIIAYLVWSNWARFGEVLEGGPIRWGFLVLGFAISLSAVVLTFLRWYLLVWAQRLPFRVLDSLRIGFIGYFFNRLIPGAVGGDLVKAVLLAREQERRTVAIATVLIDRILGLFGLILLGGLVMLAFWQDVRLTPQLVQLAWWTGGLFLASSAGLILLFSRWVHESVLVAWISRLPVVGGVFAEAFVAMSAYRSKMRVVALAIVMSVIGHAGFVLSLRCAALALSSNPPAARIHFMVTPLGLMVGGIPATPGGLGLTEGAMEKLFDFVNANGALALLMMLAFRGMEVLISALGMLYYLASRRETTRALAEKGVEGEGSNVEGQATAEPGPTTQRL